MQPAAAAAATGFQQGNSTSGTLAAGAPTAGTSAGALASKPGPTIDALLHSACEEVEPFRFIAGSLRLQAPKFVQSTFAQVCPVPRLHACHG